MDIDSVYLFLKKTSSESQNVQDEVLEQYNEYCLESNIKDFILFIIEILNQSIDDDLDIAYQAITILPTILEEKFFTFDVEVQTKIRNSLTDLKLLCNDDRLLRHVTSHCVALTLSSITEIDESIEDYWQNITTFIVENLNKNASSDGLYFDCAFRLLTELWMESMFLFSVDQTFTLRSFQLLSDLLTVQDEFYFSTTLKTINDLVEYTSPLYSMRNQNKSVTKRVFALLIEYVPEFYNNIMEMLDENIEFLLNQETDKCMIEVCKFLGFLMESSSRNILTGKFPQVFEIMLQISIHTDNELLLKTSLNFFEKFLTSSSSEDRKHLLDEEKVIQLVQMLISKSNLGEIDRLEIEALEESDFDQPDSQKVINDVLRGRIHRNTVRSEEEKQHEDVSVRLFMDSSSRKVALACIDWLSKMYPLIVFQCVIETIAEEDVEDDWILKERNALLLGAMLPGVEDYIESEEIAKQIIEYLDMLCSHDVARVRAMAFFGFARCIGLVESNAFLNDYTWLNLLEQHIDMLTDRNKNTQSEVILAIRHNFFSYVKKDDDMLLEFASFIFPKVNDAWNDFQLISKVRIAELMAELFKELDGNFIDLDQTSHQLIGEICAKIQSELLQLPEYSPAISFFAQVVGFGMYFDYHILSEEFVHLFVKMNSEYISDLANGGESNIPENNIIGFWRPIIAYVDESKNKVDEHTDFEELNNFLTMNIENGVSILSIIVHSLMISNNSLNSIACYCCYQFPWDSLDFVENLFATKFEEYDDANFGQIVYYTIWKSFESLSENEKLDLSLLHHLTINVGHLLLKILNNLGESYISLVDEENDHWNNIVEAILYAINSYEFRRDGIYDILFQLIMRISGFYAEKIAENLKLIFGKFCQVLQDFHKVLKPIEILHGYESLLTLTFMNLDVLFLPIVKHNGVEYYNYDHLIGALIKIPLLNSSNIESNPTFAEKFEEVRKMGKEILNFLLENLSQTEIEDFSQRLFDGLGEKCKILSEFDFPLV
eukprot:TRINITY_DN987_c0_g1_i1.p1 TRINITY_DN987_c0_g1~~TRINITY_DN987_c0_g1_i1.p1  ORF type:complete len:1002 (-),score=276.37 TRINITY_DN987_c0_g1_i1:61-3066(-)